MMKGNVISRINIYLQDLEKFKARWDQLKPNDDIIETGDKDVLEKSAQIIKEKKKEFDELETMKEKLMYVYFPVCLTHECIDFFAAIVSQKTLTNFNHNTQDKEFYFICISCFSLVFQDTFCGFYIT